MKKIQALFIISALALLVGCSQPTDAGTGTDAAKTPEAGAAKTDAPADGAAATPAPDAGAAEKGK